MSKKTTKQKKNDRMPTKKRILLIAGAILLLGASGVGTYALLKTLLPRTAEQNVATQNTTPPPTPTPLTPDALMSKIRSSYEDRYTILNLEENNQPKDGELAISLSKDAPLLQTEGYSFLNDYNNGASIRFAAYEPLPIEDTTTLPTAADAKLRTEIAALLTDEKLTKSVQDPVDSAPIATDTYTGRGLVCEVEAVDTETSLTHISCGEIKEYEKAAKEYKPFVDLITETTGDTAEGYRVADLTIRKSDTEGYKVATLTYFNATALFYTLTDGTWSYFQTTQNILACTAFDTTELRAAFRGERCIDITGTEAVLL